LPKTEFLSHNFSSRCARKQIKGYKGSDESLGSKKSFSQKLAHWVGAQGRVKVAKEAETRQL